MLKSVRHRVGKWIFAPSAHELRCGQLRVRLEQRASATLSLLCERAGDVVSRDEIVECAWGKRHLSSNSVAVVVSDLRRALDLVSGEPGSIETVPKAGYRLVPTADEADRVVQKSRRWIGVVPVSLVALVIATAVGWNAPVTRPEIAVGYVQNSLGSERFLPLIRACRQTVLVELGKHASRFKIVEIANAQRPRNDYVLEQRWVLWSGQPELILVATDAHGRTFWSGAIFGNENTFPAKIAAKLDEFASTRFHS